MSIYYNTTGILNTSDLVVMGTSVNTASGDIFSLLFVLCLWALVFSIATSNFEKSRYAFIVASVFTLLISIGLVGIQWVTNGYVIFVLIAMSTLGLAAGMLMKD